MSVRLIWFVFSCLYLYIYYPYLNNQRWFFYDDPYLIGAIESSKTFFDIYKSSIIWDIQPVRDLIWWLEYKLSLITGFKTYRVGNLILWYLSCLLLHHVFISYLNRYRIKESENIGIYIAGILLIHPASSQVIFWLSARKHLLALFFIAIATYQVLSKRKLTFYSKLIVIISYFLSTMSHPIYAFWFIWLIYREKLNNSFVNLFKNKFLVALSTWGLSISMINYIFYKYVAISDKNSSINVPFNFENLFLSFSAYGQYIKNLLWLKGNALFYDPFNINVWIFLALFLLVVLICYLKNRSLVLELLVLLIAMSFTYTFFLLGTYVQNSYALFINGIILLIVSVCIYSFIKNRLVIVFIAFSIGSAYYSIEQVDLVTNDYKYFIYQDSEYKTMTITPPLISRILGNSMTEKKSSQETLKMILPHLEFIKSAHSQGVSSRFVAQRSTSYKIYYSVLHYIYYMSNLKEHVKVNLINDICTDINLYCNLFKLKIQKSKNNKELYLALYSKTLNQLVDSILDSREKKFIFEDKNFLGPVFIYLIDLAERSNLEHQDKIHQLYIMLTQDPKLVELKEEIYSQIEKEWVCIKNNNSRISILQQIAEYVVVPYCKL